MEFLITEKQLRKILSESKDGQLSSAMKTLRSFVVDLVNKVRKTYNLNLRMFLTWGTSVGGFLLPLDHYIRTGEFNLNDEQRMLILSGVCFMLLLEGKRGLYKVMEKIEEEGLEEEFDKVLSKAIQLKDAFKLFMETIMSTIGTTMEVVSYSFLLPIIPDLFNLSNNVTDIRETASLIAERLIASGVVLMSKEVLTEIIDKLLKKFK